MTVQDALKCLTEFYKSRSNDLGITKIGIFGSVARNESTELSDIDIVVEMTKPDLFVLVAIKQDLEDIFQRPVDIVRYRPKMNRLLKQRIEQEAVYV